MRKLLLLLLFTAVTTMVSAQKYVGGDISMLKKFLDEGAIYNDKDGNSSRNKVGMPCVSVCL